MEGISQPLALTANSTPVSGYGYTLIFTKVKVLRRGRLPENKALCPVDGGGRLCFGLISTAGYDWDEFVCVLGYGESTDNRDDRPALPYCRWLAALYRLYRKCVDPLYYGEQAT